MTKKTTTLEIKKQRIKITTMYSQALLYAILAFIKKKT